MPPAGNPRPEEREYDSVVGWLARSLDAAAAAGPNPGGPKRSAGSPAPRIPQRHPRPVGGLDVDTAALLPADESSHGFDNITVGDLSPHCSNRYLSAAQKNQPAGTGQ